MIQLVHTPSVEVEVMCRLGSDAIIYEYDAENLGFPWYLKHPMLSTHPENFFRGLL